MTSIGLKTLFEDQIDIERQFLNTGTGPIFSISWILRQLAKELTGGNKKKFMDLKVSDLFKNPAK